MKLVELPHGHLSWSGLSTWENDPMEYVEKYILNQQSFSNDGQRFGKYVADQLESEEPDRIIATLKARLPSYDKREHEAQIMYKGIPLLGRIDTYRAKDSAFREYKTGKRDTLGNPPWTSAKAKSHGQIAFYAFMLWLSKRKVPPTAYLDWIETKVRDDGTVGLAEEIHSFEVPITLEMIIKMGARIEKAARQINKEYLTYKNYVIKSEKANVDEIRAKSKYVLLAGGV